MLLIFSEVQCVDSVILIIKYGIMDSNHNSLVETY